MDRYRQWPAGARTIIALSTKAAPPSWELKIPQAREAPRKREGFSIRVVPAEGE